MADNFIANPGVGGDEFAADDVAGVKYPRSKIAFGADGSAVDVSAADPFPVTVDNFPVSQAVSIAAPLLLAGIPVPFAPGYSVPADTVSDGLPIDPGGNVAVRGPVLTDEGTFRANFAGTSLAVSVGAVTISGAVVTGTGFSTADIGHYDYFKLDADAESAWMQVNSIDSDTQLTLVDSYVGGASGAASRALVKPSTGAGGGAIAVASGTCTMTTGTTNAAVTSIYRKVDVPPMVFRGRVNFSQRIANQTFRIGLSEPGTVSSRWFARFKVDGTVNTTVICESGRNPTGVPSAAETETTTITLPNGATTALNPEYRVEMLTERAVFFINDVLVATHVRSLPLQRDGLEAAVVCINGTGAGSSTTVSVDYLTGKNHNKLEIGVMSDTEKIIAGSPPVVVYDYSVAGVIAINTTLLDIDCSQLRSLLIHCTSMGTTGVVTAQWSNFADFTGAVTATLLSEAGATTTTFNAAVLRSVNIKARYFRLRLTTATTAGTTTIRVVGSQDDTSSIVTTQPVSGTVTATVTGGTVNPVVPGTPYFLNAAATTNGALILTGTSNVSSFYATNEGTSVAYVKLYNKATAPTVGTDIPEMTIPIPAAAAGVPGVANPQIGFHGFRFALGLGISVTRNAVYTDTTAIAANEVKVKLSRTV